MSNRKYIEGIILKNIYLSSQPRIINYLLNHRVEEGTSRIIKGNSSLTKSILKHMKFKNKLYAGVLSFEEKNICEDVKDFIMNSFEKMLLPSLENRYNILWVEHIDKERLELNYVIPKIDLLTNSVINPYWHKADKKRVELWTDKINLLFNLSDPKDPKKRQILNNDKRVLLLKNYKLLNETIYYLISKGVIHNRDELIVFLNQSNIKVEKINKNSLKIKLPESQAGRCFKGGIYSEEFRSIRDIERLSAESRKEVEKYNKRDTSSELSRIERELNFYLQKKLRYIESKYFERGREAEQICRNKYEEYNNRNTQKVYNEVRQRYDEYSRRRNQEDRIPSNSQYRKEFEEYRRNDDNQIERKSEIKFVFNNSVNSYSNNINNVFDNKITDDINGLKGIEKNDSNRKINDRIRRERESISTIKEAFDKYREEFYRRIRRSNKNIQREYESSKRKSQERDFTLNPEVRETYSRIQNYRREREIVLGTVERIASTVESCRRTIVQLRQRNEEHKQTIRQFETKINEAHIISIPEYLEYIKTHKKKEVKENDFVKEDVINQNELNLYM